MKKIISLLFALVFAPSYASNSITLDGHHLTIEEVVHVAKDNYPVIIDEHALKIAERSHNLLILAAKKK